LFIIFKRCVVSAETLRARVDAASSSKQISVKKQNPGNRKLTFFSGNSDNADFMPMAFREKNCGYLAEKKAKTRGEIIAK